MLSTLFLQSHAFVCRAERHWVILDVNRDKYLCVDRRQFESLGPWLDGWERTTDERECGSRVLAGEAGALANRLLNLGILSDSRADAKQARSILHPCPTEALDADCAVASLRNSFTGAPAFFLSCARASRQLRLQRFESVVEYVRARKHRAGGSTRAFDSERAHSLISVFDRLRWSYPHPYKCLFDSLALIHFLSRFNVYPTWVFGVTADPFEAHCWVQTEGVVLNDTVERVSAFTPIMCL